jgi:glucokinase
VSAGAGALPALGIDIGGTKVAGGIVAPDGTVLATARRSTPGASVVDTEDAITAVVEELAARHDGDLVGVGIGAAGWFDRTGDTVLFSPHLAWRGSTLRADLAERLPWPLWVGNDADAAAWAEYRYGAARGADLALMVTLGTGIGGGIVMDGRLQRGAHGIAGEWGHMRVVPDGRRCACGNRGCWEQYASGNALGAVARELGENSPATAVRLLELVDGQAGRLTGEHVARAAADGDPAARELVTEVGSWLGQGIADLAAVLDPDVVVVGGSVSLLGELLLVPARERLDHALPGRGYRPGPRVVAAQLGPEAGLVGAADLVRNELCRDDTRRPPGDTAMTSVPLRATPRPGDVPPSG